MTPKEKANHLKTILYPIDHPIFLKMTGEQVGFIRDIAVEKFVNEMINDRKRYPKQYWKEVKRELKK